MQVISILLLSILYTLSLCDSELIYVIEQFRHGARGLFNPQYFNNTSEYEIYMTGELTPVGQRQHYLLGQKLKQIYVEEKKYIDEKFNSGQFEIISSDYNRTLQSCESQLFGLYGDGLGPLIPENLNPSYTIPPYAGAKPQESLGLDALPNRNQPIQIKSQVKQFDKLLFPSEALVCPNYSNISDTWKNEAQQIKTLDELNEKFAFTALQISNLLEVDVTVSNFPSLMDSIKCNLSAGLSIPSQLQPGTIFFNQIQFVTNFKAFWPMNCEECRKIVNSSLQSDYISKLDRAVNGERSHKWFMVSAHDTNLEQSMPLYNLTSTECLTEQFNTGKTDALNCQGKPQFAANQLIELYQDGSEFYVMVKFNGVYQNLCEKRDTKCNYQEFKQRILNSIYSENQRVEACEPQTSNYEEESQQQILENIEKINKFLN